MCTMKTSLFCAVAVCLAAIGETSIAAPRASRLIAVPRTVPVVLDGDLGEWDLSGAIDSMYEESMVPRFTARFAAMYDADALYLAAHVADDSPLRNRHDPRVDPADAWRGDCLQVRLNTDPTMPLPLQANEFDARNGGKASTDSRIVHLTLWCFSDRKEPCLMVEYGFDFHGRKVLTGPQSGLAFKLDADGRGYTLEARVPWSLIATAPGQSTPKAGDRVAFTLQPLWGDAAGDRLVLSYNEVESAKGFHFLSATDWGVLEFAPKGNLPLSQRAVSPQRAMEPLTIELPVDSQTRSLSAAVWSPQGELVRTLPAATDPRLRDGKAEIHWDGLDDDGRPLPAGPYTVRSLTHRGVGERWVTSVHSAGVPPWKTDDGAGGWGGDHGAPVAAAAGGGQMFLAWEFSEAGFTTIAVDERLAAGGKPRKHWGAGSVLEIGLWTAALASDGALVFVGQDGKRWGDSPGSGAPNRAGVVLWNAQTGRAENFPFGKRILDVAVWNDLPPASPLAGASNLSGLAVAGDRLYASLRHDGKVAVFNWKTGRRLNDLAVSDPRGLAVRKDGALAVASGKGLLRLDPADGKTTPLAADLSDPQGVACDGEGNLYVADQGTAMCVRVYAADGRPLRTVGKPGGRPALGRFDPSGMYMPHGIAVDSQGKLWVAERDNRPRRISVWDARTGKLLADLLGPGHYAVNGGADLARPSWVNTHNALFEVDYASGAVKTLSTILRPRGLQFDTDGESNLLFFRHVNGRTYVVHCGAR